MLPFHPLADIFPLIEGSEFNALVEDIRARGLCEPVTVFQGKILDGRNRARAAAAAQVELSSVNYDGDDPLEFVISKNLRRRHLRDSQRALIAARLANMPRGARTDRGKRLDSISTLRASQLLNTRARTVSNAKVVRDNGVSELVKLVERGECSVSAASIVARLSPDQQSSLVGQGTGAIVAHAHKIRGVPAKSARHAYADIWRLVDAVCDHLQSRRLDKAHVDALALEKAILKQARVAK
jgi:hypothetical protein